MEVFLAAEAGFCFGVRRALDIVDKSLSQDRRALYSLGPLIHNPQEVERLQRRGVFAVETPGQASGETLIIRTHGLGPRILAEAKAQCPEVIDATCPFVRRAQRAAALLSQQGYQVIIVGDRNHPEVIGILEWAGGKARVVENSREAARVAPVPKVGVVAQTTQPEEMLWKVVGLLKDKSQEVVVHNTICHATRERQEAARSLAGKVDLMVVVGGRNSANTRNLADICRAEGTPTLHIERADELCDHLFRQKQRVGITAGASTPDWIIEEVVQRMAEINNNMELGEDKTALSPEGQVTVPADPATEQGVAEEPGQVAHEQQGEEQVGREQVEISLNETFKELRRGDIVRGKVVQVSDNEVIVDVGGKSEGIIPVSELANRQVTDPRELVQAGDEIEVYVVRPENEEGHPILSKKRADRRKAWDKLEEAFTNKLVIQVPVIEIVKGGLLVDVGVNGFVPASLVERGYVENLEAYRSKSLRLQVIELDRSKNKVVLSQKAVLEKEYDDQRQETWQGLEVGQVRRGVVRRLTNFGAFVDLGGVDGLLHVSEITWGRVDHPRDVLSIGDEIDVVLLAVDPEAGKVSLGRKQLLPNPWHTALERYPVGSIVRGKVLRIAPFGAFVEIEPGIEGLVHISQLADRHVAKTEDVVGVGDIVPVKVLSVDQLAQRMSLSLREARGAEMENQDEPQTGPPAGETGVTIGDLFGGLFE